MTIHGTGCCLIDYLYAHADFGSPAFAAARSRREGDGGLSPGRLVFAEDFERFAGRPYEEVLSDLAAGAAPTSHNLGGPSVVALAHAAQMLRGSGHEVRFYGVRGDDPTGALEEELLGKLPFSSAALAALPGPTPRTDVLSDPSYDGGHGERTFINLIGAAGRFEPSVLPEAFFKADILAFGGTALVPPLHDALTELLRRGKTEGAATVVNLVYDFRSEAAAPGRKWKLGTEDDAYPYIDLLIADREEALRSSGTEDSAAALDWFLERGVSAAVITEGSRSIRLAARGGLFAPLEARTMPVCLAVNDELAAHPERRGDTTGCGDNFAGGLMANLAEQLEAAGGASAAAAAAAGKADLREACVWAIAAGGFACFTVGGTYYEKAAGEKRRRLESYVAAFRRQLEGAVQ